MPIAKEDVLPIAEKGGQMSRAACSERRQNCTRKAARTPGRRGQKPQRGQSEDGCVILLDRSHQGRPEADDTLTMISQGIRISIAGGGVDEKDGIPAWLFFVFFYNHVFIVQVQETMWSASYDMNKTIHNSLTCFTTSWKKSNPTKPENVLPP